MALFRKKYNADEIFDDIADSVDKQLIKTDSTLSSEDKEKMLQLHRDKLGLLLDGLNSQDPLYGWYQKEINSIQDNETNYERTMILSAAIAYFAHLDKIESNNHGKMPKELRNLSVSELLYEVYSRVLKKRDLGPLSH